MTCNKLCYYKKKRQDKIIFHNNELSCKKCFGMFHNFMVKFYILSVFVDVIVYFILSYLLI